MDWLGLLLSLFLLGLIIYLIIYWVIVYNNFQYNIQQIREQLSNVEVVMKQRMDMVHAIVQTAKKYNLHENTTFKENAEARSRYDMNNPNSGTPNERVGILNELGQGLLNLQATVEQYPDLKAELIQSKVLENNVIIERQLADERKNYNALVRFYNFKIHAFPTTLIARTHHITDYKYLVYSESNTYNPISIYERS